MAATSSLNVPACRPCQDVVMAIGGVYAVDERTRFHLYGFDAHLFPCESLRLEHDFKLATRTSSVRPPFHQPF